MRLGWWLSVCFGFCEGRVSNKYIFIKEYDVKCQGDNKRIVRVMIILGMTVMISMILVVLMKMLPIILMKIISTVPTTIRIIGLMLSIDNIYNDYI